MSALPNKRVERTLRARLIPKRMSAANAQHVGLLLAGTGHAAHNLALLRSIALTLWQHESTTRCGIKAKRLKAGWDHRYLLQVLAS